MEFYMSKINWDEYKKFKHENKSLENLDNLKIVIEFLRSFYNKTSAFEVFDTLNDDDLGKMMLEKYNIFEPEDLEDMLFRKF